MNYAYNYLPTGSARYTGVADAHARFIMEKQLKDNGDKLSEEDKTTVQTEIDNLKKIREGGNADELKTAMEEMTQKVYAIFGKLYQQEGQPGAEGPQMNDDGTIDADAEVK